MTINEATAYLASVLQRLETKLDRNYALLRLLANVEVEGTEIMSQQLDDLRTQVERTRSVQQSALTLIQGLVDKINSVGDDPAQLQALAEELRSSADSLAAAVAANTPNDGGGFDPSAQPSQGRRR